MRYNDELRPACSLLEAGVHPVLDAHRGGPPTARCARRTQCSMRAPTGCSMRAPTDCSMRATTHCSARAFARAPLHRCGARVLLLLGLRAPPLELRERGLPEQLQRERLCAALVPPSPPRAAAAAPSAAAESFRSSRCKCTNCCSGVSSSKVFPPSGRATWLWALRLLDFVILQAGLQRGKDRRGAARHNRELFRWSPRGSLARTSMPSTCPTTM